MHVLCYVVVSVTLGFMHFAFIRRSESFQKTKQKDRFIWLNFLFEKWWLFVCMCA